MKEEQINQLNAIDKVRLLPYSLADNLLRKSSKYPSFCSQQVLQFKPS